MGCDDLIERAEQDNTIKETRRTEFGPEALARMPAREGREAWSWDVNRVCRRRIARDRAS